MNFDAASAQDDLNPAIEGFGADAADLADLPDAPPSRAFSNVKLPPVLTPDDQVVLGRTIWRQHREIAASLAEMPGIVSELVRLHRTRRQRRVLVSSYVLNVGEQSVESKDRVLADKLAQAAPIVGFKDPSVSREPMVLNAELDALCAAYDGLMALPSHQRLASHSLIASLAERVLRFELNWQTYESLVEQFVGLCDAVDAAADRVVSAAAGPVPLPDSDARRVRETLHAGNARRILAEQFAARGRTPAAACVEAIASLATLEIECGRRACDVRMLRQRFDAARHAQKEAVNETVLRNLRIVMHVVSKFKTRRVHNDAIQDGCEGLIFAALRYRYWSGLRFATYASFWIKNRVTRLVTSPLHLPYAVPATVQERALDVQRTRKRIVTQTGQEPSNAVVAQQLGLSIAAVEQCVQCYQSFTRVAHELPADVRDHASDHEESQFAKLIREAVGRLPPLHSKVLRHRYGIDTAPRTSNQTAAMLNLTVDQCQNLEQAALRRLMSGRYAKKLKDYL